jgi:hypothetical protein
VLDGAVDGFLYEEVLPHVLPGAAADAVGEWCVKEPVDVVFVLLSRHRLDDFPGYGDLGTAGSGEDFGDVVDVEVGSEGLVMLAWCLI